jgi:hypothetical protein
LPITAASQRLTNIEATEPYAGLEPGIDAPLHPAQEGLGSRHVLLAGKQEGDVDRHTGKNRLLDRGQTFLRAGDLDEQVRLPRTRVQILGGGQGAPGVISQQRRNFQRHPPVHTFRPVVDRPKQARGPRKVLQRQLEKKTLASPDLPCSPSRGSPAS